MTGRTGPEPVAFQLYPTPPYRLDLTTWALRRRPRNLIDRWDGAAYERALLVDGRVVTVSVRQAGDLWCPVLRVEVSGEAVDDGVLVDVEVLVRRLLGTDIDLAPFFAVAEAHPLTHVLKDRFLGVHPPRFPDLFEALVNAVANQQLSLEVGLTLLNRLSVLVGEPAAGSPPVGAPAGGPEELVAFATPEAVLDASPAQIRRLGFSGRKTDYLRSIAAAVTSGEVEAAAWERLDRSEATRQLMAIRGVGRWSAEYVLLRGLGRLEVFPGDDVGARRRLRRFLDLDHDPGYAEIAERLRPWSPYAGMLYFHFLLDGLAERGQIEASQETGSVHELREPLPLPQN